MAGKPETKTLHTVEGFARSERREGVTTNFSVVFLGWQVLDVVEAMAEFWEESCSDLLVAEILYTRVLELSETEQHPRYVESAARARLALAKLGWNLRFDLSVADSHIQEILNIAQDAKGATAEEMGWYNADCEMRDLVLEALLLRATILESVQAGIKQGVVKGLEQGVGKEEVMAAYNAALSRAGGCSITLVAHAYLHCGVFVWESSSKNSRLAASHLKTSIKCDPGLLGARLALAQVVAARSARVTLVNPFACCCAPIETASFPLVNLF